MVRIGVDLGKRKSDVCVMGEPDVVTERFRVTTTVAGLNKMFANRERSQIAIEACRDSGWVYRQLTQLGHEVEVMDTTRARALGIGDRRRKTDRRDAEALARLLWAGVIPRAHVLSEPSARLRDVLHLREQLVAQRTALITTLRGQWQAQALEAPRCSAEKFATRLRETRSDAVRTVHVQAALAVLDSLESSIGQLEAELRDLAALTEPYERLTSTPAVKLITGLAFIAAIDDAQRFRSAHQVEAYLGLVPSERSTGGRRRLGRVTKTGNPMARKLLVQSANTLLNSKRRAEEPLLVWAHAVAARRGRKVAVVALARRLAGILWAMWRDGTFYDPAEVGRASQRGLRRKAQEARGEACRMEAAAIAAATM